MSKQRVPYKKVANRHVKGSYVDRLDKALDVAYKILGVPPIVRRDAKMMMDML